MNEIEHELYAKWEKKLLGRLSKKEVQVYASDIERHPEDIHALMRILFDYNDAHTKMNVAWVLLWLKKDAKNLLLSDYYDEIVNMAMSDNIQFRRGLLISVLLDMQLSNEPRTDFLDYCLTELMNEKQNDSCRSSMIKMAALICKPYPELMDELRSVLELLPQGQPPSIACAKRKVMYGRK